MEIYNNIINLIESNNLTIFQLEKAINLSNGTIDRWKNSNPRVDKLLLVAEYFNLPLDYFVSRDCFSEKTNSLLPSEFCLSIDEENLLETYRELDRTGKNLIQKSLRKVWADYHIEDFKGKLSHLENEEKSTDEAIA